MRPITLSTHVEENVYSHPHFFFINKRMDLGKSTLFPQSDSYVCITRKADFEYLYWACYYLWHANAFKQVSESYLYAPIPLTELNNIIKRFQANLHFTFKEWDIFLSRIRKIERTERMSRLNNCPA